MANSSTEVGCEDSRELLIRQCVVMDLTDGEFYFNQSLFEELTSMGNEVVSLEPMAMHARVCMSCRKFYGSEEFAHQVRREILRQAQEEDAWTAYYRQHVD